MAVGPFELGKRETDPWDKSCSVCYHVIRESNKEGSEIFCDKAKEQGKKDAWKCPDAKYKYEVDFKAADEFGEDHSKESCSGDPREWEHPII